MVKNKSIRSQSADGNSKTDQDKRSYARTRTERADLSDKSRIPRTGTASVRTHGSRLNPEQQGPVTRSRAAASREIDLQRTCSSSSASGNEVPQSLAPELGLCSSTPPQVLAMDAVPNSYLYDRPELMEQPVETMQRTVYEL